MSEDSPASRLTPCPDCQHKCSTHAETCPACGRFFRFYDRQFKVTPGDGWSIAVFWGIMLAWFVTALIGAAIIAGLFILGAMGAASLMQPREPSLFATPTPTPRR